MAKQKRVTRRRRVVAGPFARVLGVKSKDEVALGKMKWVTRLRGSKKNLKIAAAAAQYLRRQRLS